MTAVKNISRWLDSNVACPISGRTRKVEKEIQRAIGGRLPSDNCSAYWRLRDETFLKIKRGEICAEN